ncbi:40-residue yvtn family beta-propeller repeat-containing protein : : PQQ_2 [Gemmata massiliana]|uniref:40-residue yvtn family beta-propeller repeat-containing protein:: PQQ_2 n=1 Tax=Gemmata massiliana TaxID=1210884 RepID=A0A6P2CVZ8_9BACT|nr:hypothetical protein [Gemmata massiliana]VTR92576.1 40-residue yvtn family beta-propeller repeat-containing protein : : PQQ_2 [Gemmata massiliana]
MYRSVLALLLIASGASAADPITGKMLPLPAPGGWAMTSDGVTLVVSQPDKGELVYFDTVTERQVKRVSVDFKPSVMAVQGDTLFVGAKGASTVYALEAKTGKQKKEIDLGGDAVAHIACHPTKGLVYASTATYKIYAVDPAAGTATKTKAIGHFLAVDPINGSALFTGVQPPNDQGEILIQDFPDGRVKVTFDRWGARAFIVKYALDDKGPKPVSVQWNAAVSGHGLAISPDGKKIFMPSGGGWRPPVGVNTGGGGEWAAFNTEKVTARVGELTGGTNMAFHPVLNLGVLNQAGRDIQFFNPRSLVTGKAFSFSPGGDARPLLVTFGGKGTKVVLWNGDNPASATEGLHFLPLELTAADRTALEKVYGKLPAASSRPTGSSTAQAPKKGEPAPKKGEPAPAKDPDPPEIPLPPGAIAIAGFNDAKGENSDKTPDSPYPLGKSNVRGGFGEAGWRGVWVADPKAKFVKDVVAEGDGALYLSGTAGYGRAWSNPQKGKFVIENKVRCPKDGGVKCYIQEKDHFTTGPMWAISEGHFMALNGKPGSEGDWVRVTPCKVDTWYTLRLTIDVSKLSWTMTVDGGTPSEEFRFRYNPGSLEKIGYLVEGKESIYIDALRILEADKK